MKICIIIPVHNGLHDTLQCLESLESAINQNEHTVLVVNNGSTDGTAAAITERFPFVQLLTNASNQSFAKSVNQGAKYAWKIGVEAILLLNNDTVVDAKFLQHLENDAFFSRNFSGIVSPRIIYFDRPDVVWYAGGFVNLKKGKIWHQFIGEPIPTHRYNQVCDFGTGCAMFIYKECFMKVGGFDERFNFYGEDVDFCLRAAEFRWLSSCNGFSTIKHRVSSSSTTFQKMRMKLAGEARLLWKHNRAKDRPRAFAGFVVFNLWRLLKKIYAILR